MAGVNELIAVFGWTLVGAIIVCFFLLRSLQT